MTTIYFIEARGFHGDLYLRDDKPIAWSPDIFHARMYGSPDAAERMRAYAASRHLAINSRVPEAAQVYAIKVGSITLEERERQRKAFNEALTRPEPARFRGDGTANGHNKGRVI